jgi:hypothetical protein
MKNMKTFQKKKQITTDQKLSPWENSYSSNSIMFIQIPSIQLNSNPADNNPELCSPTVSRSACRKQCRLAVVGPYPTLFRPENRAPLCGGRKIHENSWCVCFLVFSNYVEPFQFI